MAWALPQEVTDSKQSVTYCGKSLKQGGPARRLLYQARLKAMVAWGGGTEPGGYLWVYQACGTKEGVAGESEFLLGRDEVGGGGQKGAQKLAGDSDTGAKLSPILEAHSPCLGNRSSPSWCPWRCDRCCLCVSLELVITLPCIGCYGGSLLETVSPPPKVKSSWSYPFLPCPPKQSCSPPALLYPQSC